MIKNILTASIILTSVLNANIEHQQLQELFSGNREHFIRNEFQIYKNDPTAVFYFHTAPKNKFVLGLQGKNIDTVKVLVLRVDFQEDSTPLTTGNGKFNYQGNGEPEYNQDGTHNLYYDPPHDSLYFDHQMEAMRNYFWNDTKGRLWVDYYIYPLGDSAAYTVPHKMTYYGNPYDIVHGLFYLLRDAVYVADRDTVSNIDFSEYDAIILFHAGSMWQTDYGDSPYDLPAVWIGGADGVFGEPIYANNRTDEIYEAVIYCETGFQDGGAAYLQGGLAHEFGHQLGAFDLYDVSGYTMGCNGWSLHGTGNWNLDGLVPPHIDIWNTMKMNYPFDLFNPVSIMKDTTVELRWRGSLDTSATFAVNIPISSREYFLITYRFAATPNDTSHINPDSNNTRVWRDGVMVKFFDYDYSLPLDDSTGGLLIWHVDKKGDSLAAENINEINAGFPHGVDIEEADGIQDCELLYNEISDWESTFYGNKFDVWRPDGQNRFDFSSTPNTNDNFEGITHIRIDSIEVINDSIIRFNVSFDWRMENFPFDVTGTFDVNSPNICDLDLDGENEIIVNTEDGLIYAFEGDGSGYLHYTGGQTTQFHRMNANSYTSLAVGQADGDLTNGLEVVAGNEDGYIYAWHTLPAEFPPVVANGFPVRVQARVACSPALIDIDKDGKLEILIGANDNSLHAFRFEDMDNDGKADYVSGFPFHMGGWVWSTPVMGENLLYALGGDGILHALQEGQDGEWTEKWKQFDEILSLTTASLCLGDLNRDGSEDIVVLRGDSSLSVVNQSGEIIWTKKLNSYSFVTSPALADIDKDGYLDIVLTAGSDILVYNMNGSMLEGFPVNVGDTLDLQSSPVLGDVNGDGEVDIIIGTIGGWVCGFNNKGKRIAGFPLSCGDSVFSTPTITDFDGDGYIDIIVAVDDSKLYGWTLGRNTDVLPWPMLHRNNEHNSVQITPSAEPITFALFSEFYVWPNPVENGIANFRYVLSVNVETVKIDVFDIAGDKVLSINGSTFSGINENEIDINQLPAGVFIVRLEANGSNVNSVKFFKMAVIK